MERLFEFLKKFFAEKFYGTISIKFECGKVTHVEIQSKRVLSYQDLMSGEKH